LGTGRLTVGFITLLISYSKTVFIYFSMFEKKYISKFWKKQILISYQYLVIKNIFDHFLKLFYINTIT